MSSDLKLCKISSRGFLEESKALKAILRRRVAFFLILLQTISVFQHHFNIVVIDFPFWWSLAVAFYFNTEKPLKGVDNKVYKGTCSESVQSR